LIAAALDATGRVLADFGGDRRLGAGVEKLARAARAVSDRLPGEGGSLNQDAIRAAVERARTGDSSAFAELFAAHDADVTRLCRRMLGRADQAEDAKSEVFLRARRALDRYDASRPFLPWLLRLAGNLCIDQLRRRVREKRVFADLEPATAESHGLRVDDDAEAGGSFASPLRGMIAAEERERVGDAIEALPLKYRFPLVLRYFGEHDYTSIAEILGVSTNQVGSLLFRAKRMLREQLADNSGSGGADA